jgi:flagellar biosynthesis protein FlhG
VNLADFISKKVSSMGEVLTATPIENVWLVSGAKALVEMANPNFGQKRKILRHLRSLDVDHVVLDLGAGTSFNVLDFFLSARKGVMVVVPEPTSIENAYHFLKATFFRKLKRAEPRAQVKAAIEEVMKGSARSEVKTPKDLISRVWSVDPDVGAALVAEASSFRPGLIVNRVDHPSHERLGEDMVSACRDYFGIRLQFLGSLPNDKLVGRSVVEQKPAAQHFPQIPFVKAMRGVVGNLTYARPRAS